MPKCDCGGEKCGTGHSSWCSTLAKEVKEESVYTGTGITWINSKPDNPSTGHVYVDQNNVARVYSGGQWKEINWYTVTRLLATGLWTLLNIR